MRERQKWGIVLLALLSIMMTMAVGSCYIENEVFRSPRIFAMVICAAVLFLLIFALLLRMNRQSVMEKEQEIQYREQLFNILANNTDDVFLMLTTSDYTVEYVSPNSDRVLGIPYEDVKRNLEVLGRPSYCEAQTVNYETLAGMKSGESVVLEGERIHKKTGEHRWFTETVYRAVVNNTDKFIIAISDRTMEKRNRQALEEALDIAKMANESKSVFLSNMSHDIRTPMNAIVGLCTLLWRDAGNENRVREYTKKIEASSQHLLGLINDVLDMSKIESGKTTLNISEISLAEVVSELDTILRPQVKAKRQEFEVSVLDIRDEHLLGDKLRINQVMINILSNAVKYTQVGGRVEMIIQQMPKTAKNYSRLRFIVKDNGMGMSEEFLTKIFDPFTREVNNATNKIQGTGLGMAITKNLVDLMGGAIVVESKLGEGSTFTVDLEFRVQDQDIDQNFWKKYGVTHTLVVDDEVEVCTSIIGAMAGTGVSMQFAVDGFTAVSMVKNAHEEGQGFDLVLLDWKMPDMDGIETARRIRTVVPADVPIMILTAYDWSEIEDEATAAGIDGFLTKPFFLSNFRQTIEKIKNKGVPGMEPEAEASIMEGMHFLMAEDNELNSEILTELLDMVGATCETAEDGQAALEKFEQSRADQYDMILMDVQMPMMNGYEATKAIRVCSHPRAKTIPIIAMTANAFAEDIKDALDAGMDAHIAKPVDLSQLESAIRGILHRSGNPAAGRWDAGFAAQQTRGQ